MQNNDHNELINTNLNALTVGIFSVGAAVLDISTAAGFSCLFAVGMGIGTSLPARVSCLLPAVEAVCDFRLTPSSIWKSLLQLTTNKVGNEIPEDQKQEVVINNVIHQHNGEKLMESSLEYLIDDTFNTLKLEGYPISANIVAKALGSLDLLTAHYTRQDNWFLKPVNPKVHIDLYGERTFSTTDPELLNHVITSYLKIHPAAQSQLCLHEVFEKYLSCGSTDCCLIKDRTINDNELLRDHYWSTVEDNTNYNPGGIYG
tara:strand:+ start:4826 stop:5602 length:777 start_codon:yes stop_codon:yes gene_type:complete